MSIKPTEEDFLYSRYLDRSPLTDTEKQQALFNHIIEKAKGEMVTIESYETEGVTWKPIDGVFFIVRNNKIVLCSCGNPAAQEVNPHRVKTDGENKYYTRASEYENIYRCTKCSLILEKLENRDETNKLITMGKPVKIDDLKTTHRYILAEPQQKQTVGDMIDTLSDMVLAAALVKLKKRDKMNKLITIGWLGNKTAYLNVSKEDAIKRYLEDNPGYEDEIATPDFVSEFDFTDEFGVYDAYK